MRKLADIITSLWLEIIMFEKELFNVILLYGNTLETYIWNKWERESVNRSLTLINQQLLWKKKGTELDSKQKISKSSLLHQLYSKLVNIPFYFSNLVNFVLFQGSQGWIFSSHQVFPGFMPFFHDIY